MPSPKDLAFVGDEHDEFGWGRQGGSLENPRTLTAQQECTKRQGEIICGGKKFAPARAAPPF
jgi:hypothetical protein